MNPSFKRFRLVEEDEFRQKEKEVRDYNPELVSETRKQSSVSKAIGDSGLTPEIKLLFLRLLQHTLKPVSETIKPKQTPKEVTVSFTQPGFKTEIPLTEIQPAQPEAIEPAQAPMAHHPEDDEVVETTPIADLVPQLTAKYQDKARQIANIIDSNPNLVKVNDKHELIINGDRVEHSNAIDLLRFISNPAHSTVYPVGTTKFINALVTLKVPYQLVSNKQVRAFIQSASQSGKGKTMPKPIGFAKRPPPTLVKARKRTKPNSSTLSNLRLYKI